MLVLIVNFADQMHDFGCDISKNVCHLTIFIQHLIDLVKFYYSGKLNPGPWAFNRVWRGWVDFVA